jgi:hypothetical protein
VSIAFVPFLEEALWPCRLVPMRFCASARSARSAPLSDGVGGDEDLGGSCRGQLCAGGQESKSDWRTGFAKQQKENKGDKANISCARVKQTRMTGSLVVVQRRWG